MNLLSWLMGLSVFFFVVVKSVDLHHSTVCRQEAWLRSTELVTRRLLSSQSETEAFVLKDCRIQGKSKGQTVRWGKWDSLKTSYFTVNVKGKL